MARRRSPVPWLYGLSVLLMLLSPVLFLGVWVADGTAEGLGPALLAAVADLVAAAVAAVVATVLAAQRGVRRVRTVVLGHPDGRAGRVAEHRAARWALARERFTGLQREYAAFEADPRAVTARPALTDVSVPATARFVDAYADAEYLATDTEPVGPRREEFAAAVDRAVAAWHEAGRVAEALAGRYPSTAPAAMPAPSGAHPAEPPWRPEPRAVGPARPSGSWTGGSTGAAPSGARALRSRLQA